jgi:hypothetical protein
MRKSVCKKNYMDCVEEVLSAGPIDNTTSKLEEFLASHALTLTSSPSPTSLTRSRCGEYIRNFEPRLRIQLASS